MIRHFTIFTVGLLFFFLAAPHGWGQEDNGLPGLFDSDEILRIELAANIGQIITDLSDDPQMHPAILSYTEADGKKVTIPLEVRTRGNFRKRSENCDFPPLKFFFTEEDVLNTIFEGQDELKLVSHCMTNRSEYEQFLFQEYLVYRLYNEFTPFSFRVRLIEITYVGENTFNDSLSSYAFFIERPKHMAARNNGKIMDTNNFSKHDMDMDVLQVLALFQYMIGNIDWSIPLLHNIELVTIDPLRPPIPVPYDFDWSGIVDAPYRVSVGDSLENSHFDRLYKGVCVSRKEFISFFEFFNSKKDMIIKLYREFEPLNIDNKGQTILAITDFYNMINRPGIAIQQFRKDCRLLQK